MTKKGSLTQKVRWLTHTLILSGTLNVLFLGIFFYFLVRENPFPLTFEYPPRHQEVEEVLLPVEILRKCAALPTEQLRDQLSDERLIQEGYRVRDFALALLTYREMIDIPRALGKKTLSERKWKIDESHGLILYPGLNTEDFNKIIHFLETEHYPQTSVGLYYLLKKQKATADPTLLQMFCQTPEFLSLEVLFGRTGLPIKRGALLALACECDWQLLSDHLEKQKAACDFSESSRRELLQRALDQGSQTAAYLLLLSDFSFALKQLDDAHVVLLLSRLSHRTEEAIRFAKEVSGSLRGDEVRQKAAECLHAYGITSENPIAAKPGPRPAIGELRPVFRESPPASPPSNLHIIQPGESLWLISRKYQVPIEALMQINQLSSPTIQPGKTLKIPSK